MNRITIDFGSNINSFKKALVEFAIRNRFLGHSIEIQGNNTIITMSDTNPIEIFHLGMYFERELNKLKEDKYIVVTWPESQDFIGRTDIYFINDDNGYRDFGSSAYFVPEKIYNLVMTNKDKA